MERDRPEATPPTLEALFLRWREEDDAEALGEMLARTEAELIVVARRQARDDAAAWDLVQEAWVTVLREGHKWDSSQRLMPWLVGILTICARRARRVDARTPDPQRLAPREVALPDSAVPAEEVRTLIERGLGNVSTLYGDVVRMHLFEEMTHAEIAQRTGREPGTVRVQVFRGLAQLRKHLPSSLSLGVAILALAPRSEAARLAPVLDTAFGSGPAIGAGTGSAAASTSATGASWIAAGALRWWLGAAVLVVAAGGAWWAATSSDRADVVATPLASVAPDRPTIPTEKLASGIEDTARKVASAAASVESAGTPQPGVWLVGTVAGLDRLPRATSTITLRPGGTKHPPTTTRLDLVARRDETAQLELDLTAWYAPDAAAPREFIALLDHPHALPTRFSHWIPDDRLAEVRAAAEPGSTRRVEIPARFDLELPAARVHGRVTLSAALDPALKVSDVVVALFQLDARGRPERDPIEGASVRADGTFSLRAAQPGAHHLVATLPDRAARPADAGLQLATGEERDVGTLELDPGVEISGRVATEGANGQVSWRHIEEGRTCSAYGVPLAWTGGRFETPGGNLPCAADGSFRITALAPGEYEVGTALDLKLGMSMTMVTLDAAAEGAPKQANSVRVVAPASGLVLEVGQFDVILSVTGAGTPLKSAQFERHAEDGSSVMRTDEDGHVRLRTRGTPGAVRVRVFEIGWVPKVIDFTDVRLVPGQEIRVDLEPGPAPAEVVLEAGAVSLAGALFHLVPWDSMDEAARETARATGFFTIAEGSTMRSVRDDGGLDKPVEAGHWCAILQVQRQRVSAELEYVQNAVFELELPPGAKVRHYVELQRGGRLRFQQIPAVTGIADAVFELENAAGARVSMPLTSLILRGDARQGRQTRNDRIALGTGAESALLDPGTYTLRTTIGPNTTTRTVEVRAGETTLVE